MPAQMFTWIRAVRLQTSMCSQAQSSTHPDATAHVDASACMHVCTHPVPSCTHATRARRHAHTQPCALLNPSFPPSMHMHLHPAARSGSTARATT
eukprot:2018383-Pleurochrysis_carterae.AAC.2